ncbi:MAG: hypothetical protein ACXVH1_32295 [Solirubrobacteraceae bacterium]
MRTAHQFWIHEPAGTSSGETSGTWLLLWAAGQLKQQNRRPPVWGRRRSGLDTGLVPESFPTSTAFDEEASLLRSTVDVVPRRVIGRRAAVTVDA